MSIQRQVVNETGIYEQHHIVCETGADALEWQQRLRRRGDMTCILADDERWLVGVLEEQHVDLVPWFDSKGVQRGVLPDLSKLVSCGGAPSKVPPIVEDATAALIQLKFLLTSIDSGDLQQAALHAYQAGVLCERVFVRQHECRAMAGLKTKRGGEKSARTRWGANRKDRDAMYARWQREVDDRRQRSPDLSYTAACERVAARYGVRGRTVRNNTKDTMAQKKSGK